MEKDDEIIVLQQFDNAIEANIAKTKLDAYGIPCFLTDENLANLYPGRSFFFFRIRLHLFAADRDRALQILSNNNLAVTEEGAVECPRCHSHRITRDFPERLADNLLIIFFGVFLTHKKVNHCADCGLEF